MLIEQEIAARRERAKGEQWHGFLAGPTARSMATTKFDPPATELTGWACAGQDCSTTTARVRTSRSTRLANVSTLKLCY